MKERYHRTRVSWIAAVKAWPMCKEPVTFGGGSVITNIPSGLIFPSTVNCGLKKPSLSHQAYQEDSTAAGLYFSKAPSSRLWSTAHVSLYSEWPRDLFYAQGQWCHGMSYPWPRHPS